MVTGSETRLNTVAYVICLDSASLSQSIGDGESVSFGEGGGLAFFRDGTAETINADEFALGGHRQLTESRPRSMSGLYQFLGPSMRLLGVRGNRVVVEDASGVQHEVDKDEYEANYEVNTGEASPEDLADRALDIPSVLETIFINAKLVSGVDLVKIIERASLR